MDVNEEKESRNSVACSGKKRERIPLPRRIGTSETDSGWSPGLVFREAPRGSCAYLFSKQPPSPSPRLRSWDPNHQVPRQVKTQEAGRERKGVRLLYIITLEVFSLLLLGVVRETIQEKNSPTSELYGAPGMKREESFL
ncbi:hypothetical protein IE53DRAFT_390267 [Violaceomyces palustris]|uniref:Uncharacterized protein n=1 Tax=Violaceomyces palustris TaxID=1673888 RepID=A0ACD0NPA1_9BASI|nr:hypothetical protein IE53DRAFT_390267 [Violaceomyces palustris]